MWAKTFHFQGNKLYPRAHSPILSYTNDCSWRSYRSFFFFFFFINDKLFFFSVCEMNGIFSGMSAPKPAPQLFLLTVMKKKKKTLTKLWPQCRDMTWSSTFVKRSTPNAVSAICNKRKKKKCISEGLLFFQDEANLPVHSQWSQVIYFFMDCSIHKHEMIPPKMTWMNGSYTVL